MPGDGRSTGYNAAPVMSDYGMVFEDCGVTHLVFTWPGKNARAGLNLITSWGAIAGDNVTTVVGLAAMKDAVVNMAAGGALVRYT